MPCRPSSSARILVRAATATLRMLPTVEPVERAARPLMLTMRPLPRPIEAGAASGPSPPRVRPRRRPPPPPPHPAHLLFRAGVAGNRHHAATRLARQLG